MEEKKIQLLFLYRIQSTSQRTPMIPKKNTNVKMKLEKNGYNPIIIQKYSRGSFWRVRIVRKICRASGGPALDNNPGGQKSKIANPKATPAMIMGETLVRNTCFFNNKYIPNNATKRINV